MTLDTSTRITAREPDEPRWWRGPDGFDHAFRQTSGWMRSRCGDIRWTAALTPALFGPSNPCGICSAAAQPLTESEARLMDGNR